MLIVHLQAQHLSLDWYLTNDICMHVVALVLLIAVVIVVLTVWSCSGVELFRKHTSAAVCGKIPQTHTQIYTNGPTALYPYIHKF